MNYQRLLEIFIAKLNGACPLKKTTGQQIVNTQNARNKAWWQLMEKHGCRMIPSGQMADLVNNGPGDYVCMKSFNVSVVDGHWVLVPKELATKILALGYLP